MYEKFTDRARKAMQLANQEALRLNHECLGTEHILIGIMKVCGVAATVLARMGVNPEVVMNAVRSGLKEGPNLVTMGKLPQTLGAREVIRKAIETAGLMQHNYVGTEHLLLGCIYEHTGIAATVLRNMNVDSLKFKVEWSKLVGHPVLESPEERKDKVVPRKPPIEHWDQNPGLGTEAEVIAASKQLREEMEAELAKIDRLTGVQDVHKMRACDLFMRRRWAEMIAILQNEVADKFPEIAPWIMWTTPTPQRGKKEPLSWLNEMVGGGSSAPPTEQETPDVRELFKKVDGAGGLPDSTNTSGDPITKILKEMPANWVEEVEKCVAPSVWSIKCSKCGKTFETDIESGFHPEMCYECKSRVTS